MASKRCMSLSPSGGVDGKRRRYDRDETANSENSAAITVDETGDYNGAMVSQDLQVAEETDEQQRASVDQTNEEKEVGFETQQMEDEGNVECSEDKTAGEARGRPRRSSFGGKASEAGVIKQIYCENFMCHQKLTVDLNRNVNFIHGQNGSGKSAILAAIQICLGAGARRTHRARNVKELVRKDAATGATPNCAKVRVTLLNHGSDGYKNDLYGDTITVERVIALRGGYNGYRLLDAHGKEQSRSKKDLDEMIDTLNIQVENPVSVLDQEEAKKFLMGKPEDKYNFFLKATELARCDRTYASTLDTVEELVATKKLLEDSLEVSNSNVAMLKKKWEEHEAVEKLNLTLRIRVSNYLWAKYHEVEEEFNKSVQVMQTYQVKAARKQEEIAEADEAFTCAENNNNRGNLDDLIEEAKSQAALKLQLEGELKAVTSPYKKAEHQLHSKLQQTEEELATAKNKVDELKQAQSNWLRSFNELEPSVQDVSSKVSRVKEKLRGENDTIRRLRRGAGNSIEIFGRRVVKVAKLVEQARREHKFRGKVVGPVGSFIKIAAGKEEYASIAEYALGFNVLDRFIVTNDHDNAVMIDIRSKAGCKQDVGLYQIEPSDRYRIPPPPEIDGIETVASVLTICDTLVFNCLVDNSHIDQRALARSKSFSEQQLLGNNGNRSAILVKNIKKVFCLPRGDQWEVKDGMHGIFSNSRELRQTIGVDRRAAVAEAERKSAQLNQELQQLNNEEGKLQHEHSDAQKEWNRARKAVQENTELIDELTEKIVEIKEETETLANVTFDTAEYEDDVQQAEEVMEQLKVTEQALHAEMEESRPKIDDAESRLDDCNSRNEKVLTDLEMAEDKLTELMESQSQIQEEIEKKRRKLRQYEEKLSQQKEDMKTKSEAKDKALAKARKVYFCTILRREDEGRNDPTQEELEAIKPQQVNHASMWYEVQIESTEARIKEERERRKLSHEGADVALAKYTRAMKDIQSKRETLDESKETIRKLYLDLNERKKKWRRFRRHLSEKADECFDQFLSPNGYSGCLDFDDDKNQLNASVQKTTSKSLEGSKDIKALSGGEKSYATICLLFALGEELEAPFRILDEFDVFLDPQARKLSIKLLIKLAKHKNKRQFIFITPQDLSSIKTDPELKILKLADPRKPQDAGGPSQQTLDFVSQD